MRPPVLEAVRAVKQRHRLRSPRLATSADEDAVSLVFAAAFAQYVPRLGPTVLPDSSELARRIAAREVFVIDGELPDERALAATRVFGSRTWARPVKWRARPRPRAVGGARGPADHGRQGHACAPVATVTLSRRGRTLSITDLAVHPTFQKRRLGRALLMFAETRAYRLGLSRLEVTSSAAMWETQALYAKLGFEELDVFETENVEYIQFFKRLGPNRRRGS